MQRCIRVKSIIGFLSTVTLR